MDIQLQLFFKLLFPLTLYMPLNQSKLTNEAFIKILGKCYINMKRLSYAEDAYLALESLAALPLSFLL